MPVITTACVNCLCRIKYTMASGSAEIIVAAINTPDTENAEPFMVARPTWMVIISGLLMITRGHRKSFQEAVKVKIASAASAGAVSSPNR